jgi:LPPG:FO 2-phospho-L-lactate transferase
MQITALAGGTGAARFLRGLKLHLASRSDEWQDAEIAVIGNTADDITVFGLRVCPDLDTVMYTLGGGVHEEQGWGRAHETHTVGEELRAYEVPPDWFTVGDRDIATHIVRTQMLRAGWSLTDITSALCERWRPGVQLLPMSDDPIETHVIVLDEGAREAIHLQEWRVREHPARPAQEFVFLGAPEAKPTSAVIDVITRADVVLLPPANPVVSIGAVLEVGGIADALKISNAPIVGVSPIIGGSPVRGMADACLHALGLQTTAAAVADHYGARLAGGLLDGWVVDDVDAASSAPAGVVQRARPLFMSDPLAASAMAGAALDLAIELRRTDTATR